MKQTFLALASVLLAFTVLAQNPPAGVISRAPGVFQPGTNQFGSATFTNASTGTSYTAEQLAAQLQSLRSVIQQTLPALEAYTQTASNNPSAGGRSVAGALSQILSSAINRNTGSNQPAATTQSSNRGTVAQILEGLLGTNAPAAGQNITTLRDLGELQNELLAVDGLLQRLSIGPSTNWNQGLTPTGR